MVGMLIVKLVPADFDANMIAGGTVGAVLQVTLSLAPSSATGVTIISLFAFPSCCRRGFLPLASSHLLPRALDDGAGCSYFDVQCRCSDCVALNRPCSCCDIV